MRWPCRSTALISLFAVALATAWGSPALAFKLSPIEMEFAPTGRGATQSFRLENDSTEPAAIEIKMMGRRMGPDGADQLQDAEDEFVVFPPQTVLMPGQNQTLRVQYVGNNAPKAELAYRLIADQLPVDLGGAPASGGQMRLLVRYVASVYVTAPGAKPEVAVEAASPQGVANASKLAVDLVNRGTQHMILRNMTLRLTGQKTGGGEVSIDLDDARLEGLVTENLLAGAKRRFLLPWPSELAPGPVHATLSLKTR